MSDAGLWPRTAPMEDGLAEGRMGSTRVTSDTGALDAGVPGGVDWLMLAQTAWTQSDNYVESSLRTKWSRSYSNFNSEHARGSKYTTADYQYRSKLFRPKTREAVEKGEAACAQAFFSTQDVVNIQPANQDDQFDAAGAAMMNELVNYRLTRTIPWFLTLQGAYQTGRVAGVIISKQWWQYEAETRVERGFDQMTGQYVEYEVEKPLHDRPRIDLVAPENFRLHPATDWIDPANTSPYIIARFPETVGTVKERMRRIDPKTGQPVWRPLDDNVLMSAMIDQTSTVRAAREKRVDRMGLQGTPPIPDHEMIWVHENIMRVNGRDLVYWTIGTVALATDPLPIERVYKHGRPYVVGYGTLEAFRVYPASKVEQLAPIQAEMNTLANQRIDNVSLALNTRYFVRESAKVDIAALRRSVPGGIVMMKDPGTDVVADRPEDVTASSYAEQDRLNADFDGLSGTFSQGSVMTNRRLNETVGGMQMLNNGANAITEYELRVFTETWVEPVLRMLVKLEASYETDQTVLALAAKQAQIMERFRIDPMMYDLLSADLVVTVAVGMGAIDPRQRMARIGGAFQTLFSIMAPVMQMASQMGPMGPMGVLQSEGFKAISAEVFGAAGFKSGERFLDFMPQGGGSVPMAVVQQMMQAMQQMKQQLDQKGSDGPMRLATEQMKQRGETERLQMQNEAEDRRLAMGHQFDMRELAAETIADMAKGRQQAALRPPSMPPGMGRGPRMQGYSREAFT